MSSEMEMAAMGAGNSRDSDPLLDGVHLSPISPPPPPASVVSEIQNDDVEDGYPPVCRICMEFDGHDDELIAPCECRGTQQFVHRCCLNHWRSVKEGFAFTHCTTCQAQFHFQVAELVEGKSLRRMKFKLFVAKDAFFMFLAFQAVIMAVGGLAYVIDKNGTFRNAFHGSWHRFLLKHPFPMFYSMFSYFYSVGFLASLLLFGVIGMLMHCIPLTSTDQRVAGCQNFFFGCGMLDCFPSSAEACAVMAVVLVVVFLILGIVYFYIACSMIFQRICQRHYHILFKKDLTQEFVVVDMKGNYYPPTLHPEHERRLRMLKLL